MNLDVETWQYFRTERLFPKLENGKANQQILESGNDCIYIGAKKDDNGVMCRCAKDESLMTKGNCIVFICNGQGSVGFANYMDVDFIGTTDIVVGYNENLNEWNGNFIATIYSQERPKYSFGRKWKTHLKDTVVKLPVKRNEDGSFFKDCTFEYSEEGYVPDWLFMETYIKTLKHKPITTNNNANATPELKVQTWGEYKLGSIFFVKGGYYNKKPEHLVEGKIPFLAATEKNNGVTEYYSEEDISSWDKVGDSDNSLDGKIFPAPAIAVTVNGSCCEAFYQKIPYTCSHDVTSIRPKDGHSITPAEGLFIATIIRQEKYRWSYGRKPHDLKKFAEIVIKLPSTQDGTPDWKYMNDYVTAMPYGDRLV